jgi:hydrogenase/urease accessory protein HupE
VVGTDRAYEIQIVTNATALLEKLEAAAGRPAPVSGDPVSLHRALKSADSLFRSRVTATFDGTPDNPDVSYAVSSASDLQATVATITLRGDLPPDARALTWSYGWTFASYGLTFAPAGATMPQTQWLEGGEASAPLSLTSIPPAPTRASIAAQYLALGFTHILPHGLDHVLFVLGIFLLAQRPRQILAQVTAFTVAHSTTLALSMYGIVTLPARIVEPLIAISIVYVALENLVFPRLTRRRLAVVFACGLLHGLGFAGVLSELGLPRAEFLTALVTFNLGVELGQLAVVAGAFLLVGYPCGRCAWYRQRVVIPALLAIACTALYWTIERL